MIYESILEKGPTDTISLRTILKLSSKENSARFSRVMNLLQKDFRIIPVGISDKGAWHYSFIYNAVHHHFPNLPEQARLIAEMDARTTLLKLFFQTLGAATLSQIKKFFAWSEGTINPVLRKLVAEEDIIDNVSFEQSSEDWYTISELFTEIYRK